MRQLELKTSYTSSEQVLFLFLSLWIFLSHQITPSHFPLLFGTYFYSNQPSAWLPLNFLIIAAQPFLKLANIAGDQLSRRVNLARTILRLAPSITPILYVLHLNHRLVIVRQVGDYWQAIVKRSKVKFHMRPDVAKNCFVPGVEANPIVQSSRPGSLKRRTDACFKLGKFRPGKKEDKTAVVWVRPSLELWFQ